MCAAEHFIKIVSFLRRHPGNECLIRIVVQIVSVYDVFAYMSCIEHHVIDFHIDEF